MKDDRDESDGEEMDHDSGESSSTSTDSTDGSDSDDSSEMDVAECERRRNECLDILADLERQFNTLREQYIMALLNCRGRQHVFTFPNLLN
ncbi:hypothetical protein O3M35_011736 [Rhynocoris fuscipes]